MNDERHDRLRSEILQLLRQHPDGLSEYELLGALDDGTAPEFHRPAFKDSLALFNVHFLLFHTLYRLRGELWTERSGHLEISPLRIVLRPYAPGAEGRLAEADPLCDYYLDLDNLRQTSRGEVDSMLDRFWSKLLARDQRREALQVLELDDPVDYATIKRRYRRLVMDHHPDRGGDKQRLQAINTAMAILERDCLR
jgi:hypothetical protein